MTQKEIEIQSMDIPVLLTLHVRSAYLENQLMMLVEAGIRRVYISIDGPRHDQDKADQVQIYDLISSHKEHFTEIVIRQAQMNLGIAVAMISGIDWFFSKNESGVIFEDDVHFTKETLVFFKEALLAIKEKPDIYLASGVQPFPKAVIDNQIIFTNYPQIWGWATYAFKWEKLREYIFNLQKDSELVDKRIKNFWKIGWKRVSKGYLDTWDLPIATGMLFSGKLCMLPPVNLTSNVGVDSYSSNTITSSFPMKLAIRCAPLEIEFNIEPQRDGITKINRQFEKHIYFIRNRHLFTPIIRYLDPIRFMGKKKKPLVDRVLLARHTKESFV
jgi:hypothetical protein